MWTQETYRVRERKKWHRSEHSDVRGGVRQTDSIHTSSIRGQLRQWPVLHIRTHTDPRQLESMVDSLGFWCKLSRLLPQFSTLFSMCGHDQIRAREGQVEVQGEVKRQRQPHGYHQFSSIVGGLLGTLSRSWEVRLLSLENSLRQPGPKARSVAPVSLWGASSVLFASNMQCWRVYLKYHI